MPAYSNATREPFVSSEALTDWQWKLVADNTNGLAAKADGSAGEKIIGVLETGNDADGAIDSGRVVSVVTRGRTKVYAGAAVASGDAIMSNGSGLAITATTGNWTIGTAREDASGSGHLIEVDIVGPAYYEEG